MSLIAVDMDGVLVDWGEGYGRALDAYGRYADNIKRHEDQLTFDLNEGLDQNERSIVASIMRQLDYFDMKPIPGGKEALKSMLKHGHDVVICTSPWPGNVNCISDKIAWLEHHIGIGWAERAIVTHDKTIIKADWLVDDKPYIKGREVDPYWKQIIFDQPYNQEITTQPRLLSWDDWDNRRFS